MLKILKSFFSRKNAVSSTGDISKEESTETKKCLSCLKRVRSNHYRCPHCRSDNFDY